MIIAGNSNQTALKDVWSYDQKTNDFTEHIGTHDKDSDFAKNGLEKTDYGNSCVHVGDNRIVAIILSKDYRPFLIEYKTGATQVTVLQELLY